MESPRPSPPPPAPLPLVQTQAPTPVQTPPVPHRLYDLQDILDKLMHFLPQLSDVVPLKNGFFSICARIDYHHPVDTGTSYAVVLRGVAEIFP